MIELHCLVCDRQVLNDGSEDHVQPSGGTSFYTRGHYGSTIFDPMDNQTRLEVVICDPCIVAKRKYFLHVTTEVVVPKESYKTFEVTDSEAKWVDNNDRYFTVMEEQPFSLFEGPRVTYISSEDDHVVADVDGVVTELREGDRIPSTGEGDFVVTSVATKEVLEELPEANRFRISMKRIK